jgi:hypothetical protein
MPAASTDIKPFPVRPSYGTTAIADLFMISPRTVTRMIDKGVLAGFRIPDSGQRRVTRLALTEFLAQNPQYDLARRRLSEAG